MTQLKAVTFLVILLLSIPTTYSQHHPVFAQNEYTTIIPEDQSLNTIVLTVSATDADGHGITYKIEGDAHNYFTLGASDGNLVLSRYLDRETVSSLDFNIIAVDDGPTPQTGTARVVMGIGDVNDNSPEFEPFLPVLISEDQNPTFTSPLATFVATDKDAGTNAQITYSIKGDANSQFDIGYLNGSLYLWAKVDYEVTPEISIVIVATDKGTPALSREKGLVITVLNVEDTPPEFINPSYTESIPENTTIGTTFLTVSAMDMDANGTNGFDFTIQSGNGDLRFTISAGGGLSVDMTLDFEGVKSYELVIHAQEQTSVNPTQQTATATVTVLITDVNDEPPDLPTTVVGVASESIEINHFVLQLTYTDIDTVDSEYVFTIQTAGAKFSVTNTGAISVISTLDYESMKTETFMVQMCEAIAPTLCDTTTVQVTVTDENDNSPVFNQPGGYTASIIEETTNTGIVTITATDRDDGVFGMVTYSITGTLAGSFSVNANGMIDNTAAIDRETDPEVVLTYIATDTDPAFPRQTSVPLTITVNDINDQIPGFLSIPSPCAFNVSESANVDIFTFTISDGDQAAIANSITTMMVNNSDFLVTGTHPEFTLKTNGLDRETTPFYTLQLTTTDQGTPPLSSTVICTVTVTDVNDQDPTFVGSPYSATLKENRAVSSASEVVTVIATDNDIGANAKLTFEIERGNDEGLFYINSPTGAIFLQNALDHETTTLYTLEVIAIDSAVLARTGTGTVTVTVSDVNDNTPTFGQSRYTMNITEASLATTVVGTITASDGDSTAPNNNFTFAIQAGNAGTTFELAPNGEIRVLLPPLFDVNPSFTLTLVVTDMGTDPMPLSSSTTVEITVIDTNNNDPVLTNTPYSFTVTEGTHANTPVGIASATDIDSDSVTNLIFSLILTSPPPPFAIDPSSGLITTTASTIDRESNPQFSFTVIVDDASSSANSDSESVTVSVVDVNDNHPQFQSTPYNFVPIPENSAANVQVGTVNATDSDFGSNAVVSYFIIGGDLKGHFKIDSSTGNISTTTTPIDFEAIGPTVKLTIEARDNGVPKRATDILVTVTIADVNDNPPSFIGAPYSVAVPEDISISATVFMAILDDKDTTTVTLTITAGNTGTVFSTSGMNVILLNSLDREMLDAYTLTLQVDDGTAQATTALQITVTDVNDGTPVIDPNTLTAIPFNEDRAPGIITTISVTDTDIGVNSKLYFELNDTFGIFLLSQSTGVLSQIASFDRETTEIYSLVITVRDGGIPVLSDTHTITITIVDLNEHAPTFSSDLYLESISEDQTVPYTLISNTLAIDLDAVKSNNGLISHSIVSVNPTAFAGSFGINEQTGQINLTSTIDFEAVQEIVLNIMARDNPVMTSNRLSSTANVIVTMVDVNDNTPVFLSSTHMISIFENTHVPSTVGVFTARDSDSGANGAITYTNVGMPTNFDFSATSGVLTLNTNFDRDALSMSNPFSFLVFATDDGTVALQNSSTITVQILDQNDNAPMFNMPSYSFSIAESAASVTPIGSTVGTVLATETSADQGANAQIQYNITHGGEGHFEIGILNGVITTTMLLDRETENTFELTVVAYDLGTNSLSTFVAVTITLGDENDNPPVFSFPTYHLNVTEGVPNMDVLSSVDIIATDPDIGANGTVTYSIANVNFQAATMGQLAKIQSILALDFETTPHYQIEILATDGGTPPMVGTATLFITLLDVNDNPPDFGLTPTSHTFSESTSGGSFLFQVTATDLDSGINEEIQYSITSGNIGSKFTIQEDSGVVTTTTSPLDFETRNSYTLTITATDKGTPPMSETHVITITITDANDNPPTFAFDPFTFTVPENDSSFNFSVPATDADVSSVFKQMFYSIRTGSEEGLFVINNMTGEISLTDTLDRELPGLEILTSGEGLHRLIIQAQDVNRTEFTATTHVQITVTDLNDNNPLIMRECPIDLIVQEEVTPHAHLLTTIDVSDADFGAAGTFTYVIANGSNGYFRVNQTGTLEVFGTLLNREMQPFYLLQLELRDMGTNPSALTSTCMINVTVLDSNNNDPIFSTNPSMTIPEDTSIDSFLLTYTATDEDIGINADIIYTLIIGNFGTKFRLGQFDGNLSVIGTLDFETLPSYTLEIYATDRGTPPRTGTGMITIDLTDVNDNAPILVENLEAYFSEGISNNVAIYTAIATDADSGVNKMIEYQILSGNDGMVFEMGLNTGILTILNNSPIDREVRDEYVLNISARDKGTPSLEDTLNLTITVTDINDETPYILNQNLTFDIIEDTVENNYTGQILITLTGSDSDIGLNGQFTFRIDGGNTGESFELSSDGVLTRKLSIDREMFDDFNLTLTIVDMGTPALSSSVYAYIDITDNNDHTPIFSNMTYTFSTFEDTALTSVIGNVTATDQDEGSNKMIMYKIPPDTPFFFSVNENTGALSVTMSLDREVQGQYTFAIEGNDQGIHPRTGTTTVIVNILDRNDNQPYFTKSYDFKIPEHYPLNDPFGSVVGMDADIDPNDVLYYHVLSGNDTIDVNLNTGKISVVRDLDRESVDFFVNGSILVSNSMTFPDPSTYNYTFSRTEILITLSDINDNTPLFTMDWYRKGVLSSTEYDSVVTSVAAFDADIVNITYFGGEIRYFTSPNHINTNNFRLDDTTGEIHVFEALTPLVGMFFDLHVFASDNRRLDPHHNSTVSLVTLWILTADLQIVITIEQTKPEVEDNILRITEILENITQSYINIDQVIYNTANNEHTDIYFHAVDKVTLGIVSRDSVIRVVDENRISVDSLFKDITVSEVKPASSPVISLDPVLLAISIALAFLVVICCCLLILCIIYDQVRRKQIKHRQRVSLLKSYDASLDYNYSLSGQTYENPMWLHPYEQWEKDDEFTKGNPLFYESQEFVMDMFRESDDEKSEETVSFGSWGASQAKMRARVGISGMSKASTLTRMSDVDQDYNVELLAEVLGDDLPPSGDDPSEISNI